MLIREELKEFSLYMIFLANYVQSFHKPHNVCDFCFFSSRKRRNYICLYLFLIFVIRGWKPLQLFHHPEPRPELQFRASKELDAPCRLQRRKCYSTIPVQIQNFRIVSGSRLLSFFTPVHPSTCSGRTVEFRHPVSCILHPVSSPPLFPIITCVRLLSYTDFIYCPSRAMGEGQLYGRNLSCQHA